MGEPHNDDSCHRCGSYNNECVFCEECVRGALEKVGVHPKLIEETMKELKEG